LKPVPLILKPNARGTTLVELVVFIVIVGVSVAGILMVIDRAARASSDPLVAKQALAIAEAFLEEVQLMPFTYCDPDDPAVSTAQSTVDCTLKVEAIGPEAAFGGQPNNESRSSADSPFDNVNDYHGYNTSPTGIKDIVTNATIPALSAYNVQVSVAATTLGTIASTDALLITVTVTGPFNTSVTLQGYRTRYAPRI
jgi:MSHA pilin protein MshD